MPITVNRAPVLTLWASVVAERLGHPRDTALTLGRAVAGYTALVKARNIGLAEAKPEHETLRHVVRHVTEAAPLLGREIPVLPTENGELRAADGDRPADPASVVRYLNRAFGVHLAEVRHAMEQLAGRYDPEELNRIGFRLYEQFRPDVPPGAEGWGAKAALDPRKILGAGLE